MVCAVVELGVDTATYDDARSIDMKGARALLRGRRGNPALEVVRRWANPRHGCRPLGPAGPVLVLPAVKVGREWRTMPGWVEAFERARIRVATAGRQPPAPAARPARSREAGHRRAEAALDRAGVGKARV